MNVHTCAHTHAHTHTQTGLLPLAMTLGSYFSHCFHKAYMCMNVHTCAHIMQIAYTPYSSHTHTHTHTHTVIHMAKNHTMQHDMQKLLSSHHPFPFAITLLNYSLFFMLCPLSFCTTCKEFGLLFLTAEYMNMPSQ